jgi:hypothetical protein
VAATNRYLAARDVYAKKKVRTRVEYNKVTALYRAAVAARESYDRNRRGVQAEYDNIVALHKTYLTFFIRTIVPPPEYDHPYTGGTLEIVRIEIAGDRPVEMIEPCQKERIGCAQRTFTGCRVYIVGDEYLKRKETAQKKIGLDYDMVLRHEVAHCNGWPHDHPDGRAPDAAMVTP